jgi:hypothetical protein
MEAVTMNKQLLFAISVLAAAACGSGPRPTVTIPEPCASLADTVSKYVSLDALPLAHIVGNPRLPRTPAVFGPGDSVYVEFLVRPDGMADTSTVLVSGASDAAFVRSALAFAEESRFVPAQSQGCAMMSKYNFVVKSRTATR